MIHTAFLMEQHLGHRTYYQNLRRFLDVVPQLEADWIEIDYVSGSGLLKRLPGLPPHWVGSLIGRQQVVRGLRSTRPNVAFFNTQVLGSLAGNIAFEQPYILCTDITPRQYDRMSKHYNHEPDGNGLIARYKHWANVRLMQRAARIVPWSTWVAESLIADYGVNPARIAVIPPGVDTALWRPDAAQQQMHRKCPRVLFVGGDFGRKGGDRLLHAFRQLPTGSAELIVVTRSPVQPEAGVTVYNNMQANSPELIGLFQTSDLFVLPTKAEAFGLVSVEAAATGLPVIGTRVGGQADITSEGKTGFLIEPDDDDALGQRLRLLLADAELRRRMGRAARQRVETHFDAKINAQRIYSLIEEVAVSSSTNRHVKQSAPREMATN